MTKKADTWMPLYVTDYLGDTMHLTTEQHGAYLLMLMACWKANGALPAGDEDLAAITKLPVDRWRKHREKLVRFFDEVEGGTLTHGRVEKERAKAMKISGERGKSGAAGAAKRWQGHSKPMANASQSPLQNDAPSPSPTSLREVKQPRKRGLPCPEDVSEQVWNDWNDLRRKKRAPVTETVLTEARRESVKAGITLDRFFTVWCARGSQGLEADWLKPHERGGSAMSFRERDAAVATARIHELTGGTASAKTPGQRATSEIIDVTPLALGR
jgi:uncharacterized protein YdaU (DUF1376 family)